MAQRLKVGKNLAAVSILNSSGASHGTSKKVAAIVERAELVTALSAAHLLVDFLQGVT